MTGQKFGQTPSSLLEIKDWWIARELDVKAALYLHEEELKREVAREKRDREFWIAMLGGKTESDGPPVFTSGEGVEFPMGAPQRSETHRW